MAFDVGFTGSLPNDTVKYKIIDTIDQDLDSRAPGGVINSVNVTRTSKHIRQSDIVYDVEKTEGAEYVDVPFRLFRFSDETWIIKEYLDTTWSIHTSGAGLITIYMTPPSAFDYTTYETGAPENFFSGVYQESYPLTRATTLAELTDGGYFYINTDSHLFVTLAYGTNVSAYRFYGTYLVSGGPNVMDLKIPDLSYPTIGTVSIYEK
jgi:hypothetical protein